MAGREILQRPLDAAGNAVTGLPTSSAASDAVRRDEMLAGDAAVSASIAGAVAAEAAARAAADALIPGTITALTGDVGASGTGSVAASLLNLPQAVLLTRLAALTADPAFNTHKLTGLADGVAGTDGATVRQLANAAFGVANKAGLIAIDTTSLSDGIVRRVATYRRTFWLDKISTRTAIDGEVIAPTTGTGWWVWDGSVDPFWITQTAWKIDPAAGDDEALGDATHAIKTKTEFSRRTHGRTLLASINITVTGSLNAGDDRQPYIFGNVANNWSVNWIGLPTTLFSGTVTAYTARNGATNQPTTMGITSIPTSWTASGLVGKVIEWTDGAGAIIRSVVVADLGTISGIPTAWLSPPINQGNLQDQLFINGTTRTLGATTVTVFDMPSLRTVFMHGGFNTYKYIAADRWIGLGGRNDQTSCTGVANLWDGNVSFLNCSSPGGADDGSHNHTTLGSVVVNVNGGNNGLIIGRGGSCRITGHATISRIQFEASEVSVSNQNGTWCDVEIYAPSATLQGPIRNIQVPGGYATFGGYVYGSSVSTTLVFLESRDVTIGFSHVPTVTGATSVNFELAGTSALVTGIATAQLDDAFNNRVIGPAGPTVNDNRSQSIAHLGSGGATSTNAANIGDATAIAAAAVAAIPAAVPLAGHAGFSLLGKATTGTGNDADIPVGTDSVTGRIGSGNVGDVPMTAAGRAMAGAASATAQTALLDNVTSTTKGLAPLSGGGTTNFLRADGTWAAPPGAGGGITSLTGEVTGTGPGATAATIANDAVTNAKAANMANGTIKARITAGTGDPEDATGTQVTALLDVVSTSAKGLAPVSPGGTSAFLRADGTWVTPPGTGGGGPLTGLTGDVATTGGGVATATIQPDAVTFAKMQNLPTDTLVGRDTAGTGDPESITVGGGIEFTGSGGIQRSALTGDVSASAGSAGTVINAGVVTNAQLATVATGTLKGRTAAGTGAPTDLTFAAVKTALAISFLDVSGTLQAAQFPALTGDVTTVAGAFATTLSATGVTPGTYGDGSHSLTIQVDAKGRVLAISAPSISISAGAVSGLAAIATTGSGTDLTNGSVGNTKIRVAAALSVLGRDSGSSGTIDDIASLADHQVLRREGSVVDWGQVQNGMLATGVVTLPKHSAFPALTVLGNPTLGAVAPTYVDMTALRTMLGGGYFDLFLAYGELNAGGNLPTAIGSFYLRPSTDHTVQSAVSGSPGGVWEYPITGSDVFGSCEMIVNVYSCSLSSIGGTAVCTAAITKNGSPVATTANLSGLSNALSPASATATFTGGVNTVGVLISLTNVSSGFFMATAHVRLRV